MEVVGYQVALIAVLLSLLDIVSLFLATLTDSQDAWNLTFKTVGSQTTGPAYVPAEWTQHEGHPGNRIDQLDARLDQWKSYSPDLITVTSSRY